MYKNHLIPFKKFKRHRLQKKKKSFTIKLRPYLPEFPVSNPEAEAGGNMDYKVRWSQKPKHHLGQV